MKKNQILAILVGFCIVFLIITSCSHLVDRVKNLQAGVGERIIVLGDSIASGYGLSEAESFPSVVSRLLNLPIVNRGVAGDTTADALNRLQQDVLSASPWLVIVELGGNDFLQKLPKTETEANLKEIITKIQEKQAIAVLLGINLGMFKDEYQEIYTRVAKETQAYLIPQVLEGIIDNPKYRQEDFVHPNAAGHQRLGERIAKDLKPLLEKAKKPALFRN